MVQMKKYLIPLFMSFFTFNIFFGIYALDNEFFQKGLSSYQTSEFQLAIAHFKEAKTFDPKNPLNYFYLGNSYFQLNDLDNAILNYTTGLNFTEEKGIFFYNLGNCYYMKGNFDFSTEMYAKAIMNDPTLFDSHLNSGNAYYQSGDYANTIVQWETYLKKYPQTPQYENIEKAIAYLREELKNPGSLKGIKGEGLDEDLLGDVLGDLEDLINRTENIMEMSEKPIDDLSSEDIER